MSCLCPSAAIIGDFAFPDSISAPAPTPNTDEDFLPLYFPPKKVLCLCIFLPCHVYIPSIHSTQGVNPRGYCTPKIYTSQSKDVQRYLDGQKTFRLYLLKNVVMQYYPQRILKRWFCWSWNICGGVARLATLATVKTHLLDGAALWGLEMHKKHLATTEKMQQTTFVCADITSTVPVPTSHCKRRPHTVSLCDLKRPN